MTSSSFSSSELRQLVSLYSDGDFDSAASERLTAKFFPLSLLLRATERIRHTDRVGAWHDVRGVAEKGELAGLLIQIAFRLLYLLGDDRRALALSRQAAGENDTSALLLHYNVAREFGAFHEASEALERALSVMPQASGVTSGSEDTSTRRFAQAFHELLKLYSDHHHYDAAALVLDRYFGSVQQSPLLWLQAARVYRAQGDERKAAGAISEARQPDPGSFDEPLEVARLCVELGEIDAAERIFESLAAQPDSAFRALEALGRLSLWRSDLEHALDCAARLERLAPENGVSRRIRAAVLVLRGDFATGRERLDAVLRDHPTDGESYLWRAEANLRLGQPDQACADSDRALQSGYSFVACLIRMLAVSQRSLRTPHPQLGSVGSKVQSVPRAPSASSQRGRRPPAETVQPLDAVILGTREDLRAEITALCGDAPELLASNDLEDLTDLLNRALVAVRGNRTSQGTWLQPNGELARLPETTSPRILSRRALELIRVASPEHCLARLDQLAARFPHSSMPFVHRGEVLLWLGRYREARADLERSIAIRAQTRWAWYGLAWLDAIEGEPERALVACARGIEVMNNTEGPVAPAVRGEALRLLGRMDEARRQLERACELNPTRLSAWANLGLLHAAQGDLPLTRAIASRLLEFAPSLMSEAAADIGDEAFAALIVARSAGRAASSDRWMAPVLQRCLELMRGNRSSGLITYFTAAGEFRQVLRSLARDRFDERTQMRAAKGLRSVIARALLSRPG